MKRSLRQTPKELDVKCFDLSERHSIDSTDLTFSSPSSFITYTSPHMAEVRGTERLPEYWATDEKTKRWILEASLTKMRNALITVGREKRYRQ